MTASTALAAEAEAMHWNGVPLNPEQDGAHALFALHIRKTVVEKWSGEGRCWVSRVAPNGVSPGTMASIARYLGPCLTPSEVAAALVQARADGRAEGLREATQEMLSELDGIHANLPTLKARDYPNDMERLVDDVRSAILALIPADAQPPAEVATTAASTIREAP